MWIKLVKHIGESTIWYSLPSDNEVLNFINGDLICCKFANSAIEKLPIAFRYVPWERTIDGILHYMELKAPYINDKNSIIELEEIEVDDNELNRYKNS